MKRLLKPERLDCDPSSSTAAQEWSHWLKTFENFLAALPEENLNKLGLLTNFVSPKIYQTISECVTYDSAISVLRSQYIKPKNEVFARHRLATCRQQVGESLDKYFQALKTLSKDCNFRAVTAAQYCEESIRDAFISGIQSASIRQRLLENNTLDLATMFDQARALDSAQKNSEVYCSLPSQSVSAATPDSSHNSNREITVELPALAVAVGTKCFFCSLPRHPRVKCPAREAICHKCQKKGHFAKACPSKPSTTASLSTDSDNHATLATLTSAATPSSLSRAVVKVSINGTEVDGLVDSGSSESFIHPDVVKHHSLAVHRSSGSVSMASTSLSTRTSGYCQVDIAVDGRNYKGMRLVVLPKLCSDVILGQDFQEMHGSVTLNYGGDLPPLVI